MAGDSKSKERRRDNHREHRGHREEREKREEIQRWRLPGV